MLKHIKKTILDRTTYYGTSSLPSGWANVKRAFDGATRGLNINGPQRQELFRWFMKECECQAER